MYRCIFFLFSVCTCRLILNSQVFLLQALDKAKEVISGLGETKVLVEVFEAAGHSKVRAMH